jgi:peptide/nickel transport system permease protein
MAAETTMTLDAPVRTVRRYQFLRRFRGNKLVVAGGTVVGLIVIAAVFAPLLAPYSPYQQHNVDQLIGPRSAFLLGTDEFGRDVLSRVLFGARISMEVALISVSIGLLGGGFLGLIASYYGGWWDLVIMRLADIIFAFPALLLAIAILALLGPSLANVMIAIGIIFVPIFTRVVRAAGMVLVHEPYVEASRACGAGDLRIMLRHVLPNAVAPIMVQTTLAISYAILSEAALSFLGLGAQPPEPSWGTMLNTGRGFMTFAPWTGIVPGAAIFLAVLGFNVLGDGLRDVLDPRMKV